MKIQIILGVAFFLGACMPLKAQEKSQTSVQGRHNAGVEYMQKAGDQAVVFNGRVQMTYDYPSTNHPYLITSNYVSGQMWYNQTLYADLAMRLDLFRDELVVRMPQTPYSVVVEPEKVDEALLAGYHIIRHREGEWPGIPKGNYLVLLSNGSFPVVKKYQVALNQEIVDQTVERTFDVKERFYVYKGGICHVVTSKGSILKLFSDRKRELSAYIKKNKLNFRKEREQTIVAIVEYYESLNP